jgi:polysaccharide chain length determinant protein (PEP-CTERM system associated)
MPIQELFAKLLAEIGNAWRFRWTGLAIAWMCCLIGWAWAILQPNVYEASARVYVDASSVLRPILSTRIISPDVATQLSYVRQALLGREHLERVMRENELDVRLNSDFQRERLLTSLRADIQIQARDSTNTVYSISYQHSDRNKAIGVVRTLLNSLVETTLGQKQQGTDTAERFLDERIAEYEHRLQEAEAARADFKKRNVGRLPGSQGGYFEQMRDAEDALEEREKELRLAETRRDRLSEQLNSETPVVPSVDALSEPPPNSIDARIREFRGQLDRLLLQYTERHPDVIRVRESLDRLEQQRREQLAALGTWGPDQELSALGSSPVYESIRIALNEAEVEIETLRADVVERRREVAELQALVDEVPEVEAELARLNRDYEVVYEQYQAMVRSRETQELSRKASDTDDVEFRVIDPPLADFQPAGPDRLMLFTAALVLSFGAGGTAAWLLAQLRPVFRTVAVLREACGAAVLGAISLAGSSSRRRRLALLAFSGAAGSLITLYGAIVLVELMGPGMHELAGII